MSDHGRISHAAGKRSMLNTEDWFELAHWRDDGDYFGGCCRLKPAFRPERRLQPAAPSRQIANAPGSKLLGAHFDGTTRPARKNSLAPRGRSEEKVRERGNQQESASSPQPSPPFDGGEGAGQRAMVVRSRCARCRDSGNRMLDALQTDGILARLNAQLNLYDGEEI